VDLSVWPGVDEGALTGKHRETYRSRVNAVRLYHLNGANAAEIKSKTGISRAHIYRLITERCLVSHPVGQIHGCRGPLSYQKLSQ